MRRIYKKKPLKHGLTLKDWRNYKSCFRFSSFVNILLNGNKNTFRDVSYRDKINLALQMKQLVKVFKFYRRYFGRRF